MAGLYCACDALVHPFRGEGFGLPIVEAMACGLPVVVTGAGPVLDYATSETAYLIPAERRPLGDRIVGGLETIGQPWLFEPDVDALVELMKRVVSDREAARSIGAAASEHIREHFTWGRTAEAVERRLRALAAGGTRRSLASASGWCNGQPRMSGQAQRAARVSLTMIVKNEQENLPTCLASVEGIFDEIVVVDTGSTDRTKEIAREFGAKVFDFEWIDNFAAARNEALSHATGDYAFWLDADDVVEPEEREKLVALLAGLKRPMPSPCSGIACGSAGSTPLPPTINACGSAGSTPPNPPFARGGKRLGRWRGGRCQRSRLRRALRV